MRFTAVVLTALLCLSARAENTKNDKSDNKDSDDAIVAAAEKLVREGADTVTATASVPSPTNLTPATAANPSATITANAATTNAATNATGTATTAEIAQDMKKENEIPVFTKSEKLVKSEGSLLWRLVASLAFIAVVGGALIFAGRRFKSQKNKGGEKARIEVLHQYHMGPKKSVALIRVAGEALLIGCTDHSVNLLKTVTLIDDEMEGALGKDFNAFLEDEFSVEDMRTALSPRARA